ncbi:hypothetical protein niasHS_010686 [Heterodera schachtii]|uniref:MADF domain-containing protein n=1 Tax=Heterodera schachtii TaxID=97005 RepID=A0ABD2ISA7_HETSC
MRQKTYVLAKAILERKDILFGSIENVVKPQAMKEKEDAWEAVRTEMVEQGFVNFERKSWRDVRNHDWQYLRRSAVAKYEHNQKAGVEMIQYNEAYKLVFEIMGNEVSSSDNTNNDSVFLHNFPNDEGQQNEVADPPFFPTFATNALRTPKLEELQQMNSNLSHSIFVGSSRDPPAQTKGFSVETIKFLDFTEQKDSPPCGEIQSDLLHSLISSSSLINASDRKETTPTHPPISRPLISSSSDRKRPLSCSSASVKSTEDEVTEAKLRLVMMKIRKEEIMMQQETYRLAQEEAKLRQERAKAELLEMQLRTERAKAYGVTL